MTSGVLIFAFDNADIDYVGMAAWSAGNIRRHLDLPVALVTDREPPSGVFDRVIVIPAGSNAHDRWFDDFNKCVTWHNTDRCDALALTPWEYTIMLDADYVVASDTLLSLISAKPCLACHSRTIDIARPHTGDILPVFGRYNFPQWWATVVAFDHSSYSQAVFAMWRMVRDNWQHYRDLYGIADTLFRNDIALSIALCAANGHAIPNVSIPWTLKSIMPQDQLQRLGPDSYRLDFIDKKQRNRYVELTATDFHAMNKKSLGEMIVTKR